MGATIDLVGAAEQALSLIPVEGPFSMRRYLLRMKIFLGMTGLHAGDFQAAFDGLDDYIQKLPAAMYEEHALCLALKGYQLSRAGRNDEALDTVVRAVAQSSGIRSEPALQNIYRAYAYSHTNAWMWREAEWGLGQYERVIQTDDNIYNAIHCDNLKLVVQANLLSLIHI